jgi:hypothetical protein
MFRTVRAVFKALQVPGVIASFPAIESLRANAKVAAGETGIVSM